MDAFAQEYNHLLVSQLDSQRQYFEGLLRSRDAQREAAEAQAVADNSFLQVKRAQSEVKLHLHAQKVAEKKLVSTLSFNHQKNEQRLGLIDKTDCPCAAFI